MSYTLHQVKAQAEGLKGAIWAYLEQMKPKENLLVDVPAIKDAMNNLLDMLDTIEEKEE